MIQTNKHNDSLELRIKSRLPLKMSNTEEKQPSNFSWVVKDQLAAMAFPDSEANLRYLVSHGIKNLVTLTEEKKPPVEAVPEIEWKEIPVEDFHPPTLDQMKEFINIAEKCLSRNEPLGVHCMGGKGRTGVMVACYLVRFQGLSAKQAIINLRQQRPGSVETTEQENAVQKYEDYFRQSEGGK